MGLQHGELTTGVGEGKGEGCRDFTAYTESQQNVLWLSFICEPVRFMIRVNE